MNSRLLNFIIRRRWSQSNLYYSRILLNVFVILLSKTNIFQKIRQTEIVTTILTRKSLSTLSLTASCFKLRSRLKFKPAVTVSKFIVYETSTKLLLFLRLTFNISERKHHVYFYLSLRSLGKEFINHARNLSR